MIDELIVKLNVIADLVIALLWRMTKTPLGLPAPVQIAEELTTMGKVFTYRQEFLPPKPGVDQIRLVVTVDGVVTDTQVMPASTGATTFKAGPEGAAVVLTLDNLDAAGNDSDNVTFPFTVIDQIAPPAPDGLGAITQIAEEFIEDPPVDPPVV